jgi:hypothetical protein
MALIELELSPSSLHDALPTHERRGEKIDAMHCLLVLTLLGSVQIRVTRVQLPLYLFRLWSKQSGCQDTARGGSESWPPGPGHDGKRAFCVVYQDRPPPCMLLAGHRRCHCQRAAPLRPVLHTRTSRQAPAHVLQRDVCLCKGLDVRCDHRSIDRHGSDRSIASRSMQRGGFLVGRVVKLAGIMHV